MSKHKKIAVCIGINDYPGTGSDLRGCVNDAKDWADELRSRGFKCRMLLDADATGDAIREALAAAAAEARPGDVVVITNSSHGTFVPDLDGDEDDGQDECWCPYDVAAKGPITDDELSEIQSSRRDGVRWIVISDSCHSGTVARFAPISTPPTARAANAPQRLVRFLPPQAFMQDRVLRRFGGDVSEFHISSPPGREDVLLMSGCQDAEYSYDAWFQGRANGAFTFAALRELRRLPSNATYRDWHTAIRKVLPSQQYPQSPNIYGPDSMWSWQIFLAEEDEGASDTQPAHCKQSDDDAGKHAAPQVKPNDARYDDAVRKQLEAGRATATNIVVDRDTKQRKRARARDAGASRPRTLVCEGDSWFDYPWVDVLKCLEDTHGHEVYSVAHKGDRLEDMAYDDGQADKLLRTLERLLNRNIRPDAILLSGGGNDIAGAEFAQILNFRESSEPGLNQSVLTGIIDRRLRDSYAYLIGLVTQFCRERLDTNIPIILHGYDYPTPDGRGYAGGFWFLPGPWLQPSLHRKGYKDPTEMKAITDELINRFNSMLENLVLELKTMLNQQQVHYVNLRGTFPSEEEYTRWWANELHPTNRGFKRVAERFHNKIIEVTGP